MIENNREGLRLNIWVLYRPNLVATAEILTTSEQFVAINSANTMLVFVHSKNSYSLCCSLWTYILCLKCPNICILGDFNVVLGAHERTSDVPTHNLVIEQLCVFISAMDLFDIEASRNPYNWSIRCSSSVRNVVCLDRALTTQGFLNLWQGVELLIIPKKCSDHHPIRLTT